MLFQFPRRRKMKTNDCVEIKEFPARRIDGQQYTANTNNREKCSLKNSCNCYDVMT